MYETPRLLRLGGFSKVTRHRRPGWHYDGRHRTRY